jgi:hypothetical protein
MCRGRPEASDSVAAASFLLMAEKWIKLADEKARADTNMKEQITVDERHPARGDDRYPTCLASCGAAS